PSGPAPATAHVVTAQVAAELTADRSTHAACLDPAWDGGRAAWQPQPPAGKHELEAGSAPVVAPKALVRLRNPNADEAKLLILVNRNPAASTSRVSLPVVFIPQEGCLRSLAPGRDPTSELHCLGHPGGSVLLNAGNAPVRAWVAV